ncbi:hypothetical protein [Candidatus Spongiisocius sp.]|uniref:hypothetical protein n=1 Tax=Candidatus Spongiisocius sp. TaxID=3101273 RepID=UPI003B5AC3A1
MTAVALVAAAIAFVWVWRILPAERPGSVTPAEASASYYPEDAVAYAWLNLAPGESPPGSLPFLFDQLDGLEGSGGLAGEGDNILPDAIATLFGEPSAWMGTEASAAVVELGNGEIAFAATVRVSDTDAAAEFMRSWLQHQEQSTSASVAQAGDFLLFGTDEGLLEEVLERIEGDHPETLASAGHFEEARAAARDGRFASAYLDLEWLTGRMGDPGRSPCPGVPFDTPEWLMVSASWAGEGLVVDLATPDVTSWWTDTSTGVTDAVVPADALGFVSIGFDPDMDRWREILGGCEIAGLLPGGYLFEQPSAEDTSGLEEGATLADALDLALGFVDLGTGLDLEADLFDHLGGQLVLVAHGPDREGSSVDGVAALSYRPLSRNALAGTIDGVANGISSLTGVFIQELDSGAGGAAPVTEDGKLSLGYVLHGGFVAFGTGADALETTVAVQQGTRDHVSGADQYRRTVKHIPYDPLLLAYVDLARVIDRMGSSGMGSDHGPLSMLSRWLGPMALGVGTDGDYTRATLVLSLLPSTS